MWSSFRAAPCSFVLAATVTLAPSSAFADEDLTGPPAPVDASASPAPEPSPAATSPPPAVEAADAKPAAPDWLSRVELGGLAFLQYRYDLTEGQDDFNSFDVTRMYVFATVKPRDNVRMRVTIDAPARETEVKVAADGTMTVTSGAGRYDIVLKHAYGELYDIPIKGLSVKFGMHDLPWVPFEEKQWTYRFQGPVLADREGYLSSTDLGIGAGYAAPSKVVDASVAVVNGETWGRPENSKYKDAHGRVTVRPLAQERGLGLSLFGSIGRYDDGANEARRRVIAQASYEREDRAGVGVEYLRAWDPPTALVAKQPSLARSTDMVVAAQGVSAFGWVDLAAVGAPAGLRAMGRLDWLDPDVALGANGHLRVIAGFGFRANKYVNVLADAEVTSYDDDAGTAVGDSPGTEERLFVHTAIGF